MIYAEGALTPNSACSGNQAYDAFIVETDYPSGTNKAYLPLSNPPIGGQHVIGGAQQCSGNYPVPSNPLLNPARTLLAYNVGNFVKIYNVSSQSNIAQLAVLNSGVSTGCGSPSWSPDGKYFSCYGYLNGKYAIQVWDTFSFTLSKTVYLPTSPSLTGLNQWLPDSSGFVVISGFGSSNVSCTVGSSSYRVTGMYKLSLTGVVSTILAPTCNSDWEDINNFSVSPTGTIAYESAILGTNSNGSLHYYYVIGLVDQDGTNRRVSPINIWQMSPSTGGYCGEDLPYYVWEIGEQALIAQVHGPNNDHTFCNPNGQFVSTIERMDVNTGARSTVINEIQQGFNTTAPTSAALSDTTNPSISYTQTPNANYNNWNNTDVTVSFTCTDDTAIASCSGPTTLTAEGAGQQVTGTAVDTAGNSATTTATVNIDKTAPTISYSISPAVNSNGWSNGDVVVSFSCNDTLSGIDTCTNPVTVSSEGNNTVTGTATDKAGNTKSVTVNVNVDKTAPTITYLVTPSPNINGWNQDNVIVSFLCSDSLSGIDTCSDPVTLSSDGANQTVTGTAVDKAGNSASVTATINLDKTAPVINSTASPAPNINGWNNTDVTISYTCSDSLSGIDTCSSPATLSSEGANQQATGTATDKAGNSSTTTATVNIDKTAPTITASVSPAPNSDGWNNSDVTVSFACSDSLSGIDICPSPITLTEGAGQIITGTATDKAGNTASASVMVNVDKTAPTVSNLSWVANPLQQGQNTTLMATVSDSLSGVKAVSYSLNGGAPRPMTYDPVSGNWIVTFGSGLPANTYNITVTATDIADNSSLGTNDVLVVYTTANGYVNGHAKTLPTAIDVLPISLDASKNPADLVMGFTNVTAPMSGSFDLDYAVKNKQDEFSLSSTSISWVVVQDSTHASILGHADMTTWVNGAQSVTANMTVRYDITLGASGSSDHVSVKIFNPGVDPYTGSPAYTISDDVEANGSNLMIHP
jgi:hypothetical protein